jgi:hypothetical protein
MFTVNIRGSKLTDTSIRHVKVVSFENGWEKLHVLLAVHLDTPV